MKIVQINAYYGYGSTGNIVKVIEKKIRLRTRNVLHILASAKHFNKVSYGLREVFGNVIIEAEALSILVIASEISGTIDTMQEMRTGLFVEKGNRVELYRAMEQMAALDLEQWSKNAFEYAKNNFGSKILNQFILERKQWLIYANN